MKLFDINNTFSTIFGYQLSGMEFLAAFFGLLSIWLAAKQIIWTWSTGLINVVLSLIIFYQVQLYSDMLLQVYFFVTNIYGWVIWKNHFQNNKPVTALSVKTRLLLVLLITVSTLVGGILIKNIHLLFPKVFILPASFPFIDTFIAVASIIATNLLAKRILDNWVIWLAVDAVCVFVYASKHIAFISIEYSIFCLIACLAFFSWLKSVSRSNESSAG